eukprot:scaffold287206_cov37-Tisochrysis_lutea.AAC.4
MASELHDYLIKSLGEKHAQHAPVVAERLKEQCCLDVDTLKQCWEELKPTLPAVAQKMINDSIFKEQIEEMNFEQRLSPVNWVKASVISVLMVFLGAIIGGFQNADGTLENGGVAAGAFDNSTSFMWGWVWGPLIGLGTIQISAVAQLGPQFGWDMIQERSDSVSMRETMRSNMTNIAIVGALFLATVWAMLQSDPPIEGFPSRFISQWYSGLLTISIAFLLISVMTCVVALLYVEGLDNQAALKCVGDNFMYFGEPIALTLFAMLNTIIATIIWIFGAYGMAMGIISVVFFFWACLRTTVIYLYLSEWTNPFLDLTEVQRRKALAKSLTARSKIAAKSTQLATAKVGPQGGQGLGN